MSSLPKRHEAIAPLARRWTRADITPQLDACHASIDWTEPAIYDAEPQAHCTVYNLGDGAAVHTSATDSNVKVRTCHPTIPGLEFRLVSRGDALVAEVWSDGARVARRALGESTGTKVLGAGVFGHPCFSRGGSQVVWTAERRCGRSKVKGYWPEQTSTTASAAGRLAVSNAQDAPAGVSALDKYRPKRGFGETIGVEDSVLVAWRWADFGPTVSGPEGGPLTVFTGDDLLSQLPDMALSGCEWRGVPVHPSFDGSEDGLLFSLSLLPKRGAGLSACLNRRTLLCHMPQAFAPPTTNAAPAAAPPLLPPVWVVSSGYVSSFARLSPDGRRLAYAHASHQFAGHSTPFELRVQEWDPAAVGGGPAGRAVTLLDAGHGRRRSGGGSSEGVGAAGDGGVDGDGDVNIGAGVNVGGGANDAGAAPAAVWSGDGENDSARRDVVAGGDAADGAQGGREASSGDPTFDELRDGDGWCGWCGFHDELASMRWLGDDALLFTSLQRGEASTFLLTGVHDAGSAAAAEAAAARMAAGDARAGLAVESWGGGGDGGGASQGEGGSNEDPALDGDGEAAGYTGPPARLIKLEVPHGPDLPDGVAKSVRLIGAGVARTPGGAGAGSAEKKASGPQPQAYVLVAVSSFTCPPQLWACAMRTRPAGPSWTKLADVSDLQAPPALASVRAGVLASLRHCRITRLKLPPSQGGAETFVIFPSTPAATAASSFPPTSSFSKTASGAISPFRRGPRASVPWVVRPHGGPHAMSASAFSVDLALLLTAGVAVVVPNYRGSLGYGRPFAEALLGRAGQVDVSDVAELTRLALDAFAPAMPGAAGRAAARRAAAGTGREATAAFPTAADSEQFPILDPARGALFGGSHGGFLTAWLLASPKHKALFRAGVLWNPVVDLPAMLAATDIPEWCVPKWF